MISDVLYEAIEHWATVDGGRRCMDLEGQLDRKVKSLVIEDGYAIKLISIDIFYI